MHTFLYKYKIKSTSQLLVAYLKRDAQRDWIGRRSRD